MSDKRGLDEGPVPLEEAPSSKRLKLDENAAAAGAGTGLAAAWCPPTREHAAEAHSAPMRSSSRPSSAGSLHPAKEEPMMLDLHADTAALDQAAKPDQLWAAAAAATAAAAAVEPPPPPPAPAVAPGAAAPAPASPPAAASPADVPAGGPDASASVAAPAAAVGALTAPSALGGLIAPMGTLLEGASPGADGDAAAEAASALQQLLTAAASAASAGAHGLPPGVTAVPLLLPPEMISQLGRMPAPEAADNDGDEDFDPATVDDESDLHGGPRLSAKATAQGAKLKPGAAALVQRMQRRKNASPSTSSYKGVTRHRRTGRWEAHIWDGASPAAGAEAGVTARPGGRGKQLYLGSYDTELDAARVYDRAALAFFKRKAVLNFNIEDYEDELAGLLAITDRSQAVQLIRTRFRTTGAKTRSSKYRGVSLHASGRWEARITLGAGADRRYKGTKFLGLFDSQEQAAAAYDAAALQLHGDRAVLNFEESATATAAAVAELAASGNATAGHILLAQQQAGEAGSIKAMVKQLNELEAAAAAAGAAADGPLDAAADGVAAIAAAAGLPPPAPTQPPKKSRSGARKPKHPPPPLAPLAPAGVPGLPMLVPSSASAAAFGAPLPPWGGGDAGRSPPRDETDPLVLAAHAGAAASAAATAAALASGSIATTRQRRSNAGKRLTKYGSEDYEADDTTLQMLAEQGVDISALPPPVPLAQPRSAAAMVPKARKQNSNWGVQRPLAGMGSPGEGNGAGGAAGGSIDGGLGDALMALATAAGGADSANDDGDLLGFPVPLPKGLRLQPQLSVAGAAAGSVPGLPQLSGGGDVSADAGDNGAAAADGDAAAAAAAAATSVNPIDAAAVAHATAAAVARASAAAAKVAAREAALKPMVMAAQDSRPPRGGSALRTAARKRAMAEAAQQQAFGMLHASVGPAFAAAAAAAAAALAAAPPMTPAASGALPRLPAGHGNADAGSSEPASAAASGSTGGAHAPRLPPLPEIDFVPGEVTDPKAKSLAVNGVLSLLKALDIDSGTRARVFKSLNAQLADPASAAHFLSVPYQFMRWCCSEGDVDAVRTAVLEIASADVPGAAASVDGGSM